VHVGLIVDHPKRDLPGALMLAYQLSRRGSASTIIPMYEQGVDIPRLELDAVVANYAREANKSLIAHYAKSGLAVFVLDTEGGVLASEGGNSPKALARRTKEEGYGSLLSGYFFWGAKLCKAFATAGVLGTHELHVTGCPRFDFAAPRWRGLLDRPEQDYLLINANFPLVNPRFSGSPTRERASMVKAGWDAAYVDRLINDLGAVFKRYLAEIKRLAMARPQRKILVRPHPFENEGPYRDMCAELANVTVDGSGSVLSTIRNASAVIHLNCGTAIEAVMLNKLPIQLDYLNTTATARHAALPAMVSRSVGDFEELLGVVDELRSEEDKFDFAGVYKKHIEDFFFLNDGAAASRVADVLVGIEEKGHSLALVDTLKGCRPHPSIGQLLKGGLSAAVGSAAASSLRSVFEHKRRDKALDPAYARDLLQGIAEIDGGDAAPIVARARCRITGVPLASLSVRSN
jgi:surface carbohydrate biosynthesis protein